MVSGCAGLIILQRSAPGFREDNVLERRFLSRGVTAELQSTTVRTPAQAGRMIRSMANPCVGRGAFLLIMSFPSLITLAQDRPQARSMVITKRGIVATAHTSASHAAAQALSRG